MTIRSPFLNASLPLLLAAAIGCPSTPPPVVPTGDGPGPTGPVVPEEVREGFREAVAGFMEIRRSGRPWTREQCADMAERFEEVSEETRGGLAEAMYNRGVAFQQCGMHDEAKQAFSMALQIRQDYPAAIIQLGVYELLANNVARAEEHFLRVTDRFGLDPAAHQAYINLGVIAATRGNFQPGRAAAAASGPRPADTEIGNALAIQADSVVALENLARFYFDYSNQSQANARFRRFAQLICSYAVSKNNLYAPIYNLRGLIYLREDNIRAAIGDFQKARTLDPDFYEAHLNYASLNLGFRGYAQALHAFREAIRIRPDSYDALVGLGVAIRGLASEAESGAGRSAGEAHSYEAALEKYEAARRLDAERPEAYLNVALLYHGFLNDGSIAHCDRAVSAYDTAVQRAQAYRGNPGSGVDYAAIRQLAAQKLERARKDCETLRQLQAMEVQAREVERRMQEAAPPAPPPSPPPEAGGGGAGGP